MTVDGFIDWTEELHANVRAQSNDVYTKCLSDKQKAALYKFKDALDRFITTLDDEEVKWPDGLKRFTDRNHIRFVEDMIEAGLENKIRHYRGRGGYDGPAADINDPYIILSRTDVKCVWDTMGMDYIVYPAN